MGVLLRVATPGPNVPRQRKIREGSRAQNCASGAQLYANGIADDASRKIA